MRIMKPSIEIMRHGLETNPMLPEQFIEKVGRTCYKSEDKITDTSAAKFVANLIKREHEAMIEHWSLVFQTNNGTFEEFKQDWTLLLQGSNTVMEKRLRPYIRFTDYYKEDGEIRYVISANMRAWRDYAKVCIKAFGQLPQYIWGLIRNYPLFFPEYQDWVPKIINNVYLIPIDIRDLSDDERRIHQDVTVKFICDRGVSHEIVRHRVASFAQESTRYCNYSGDKYGKEITVIMPAKWIDAGVDDMVDTVSYRAWYNAMVRAEKYYFRMLEDGCTPQEARSVLPSSLKTEVIVTMNLDGWDHFFGLRCAPDAHPDIQVVAKMARDEFATFSNRPLLMA